MEPLAALSPTRRGREVRSGGRLYVDPDIFELGAEIVTRRHFPAHQRFVSCHDAVPPQQLLLVGLLVQTLLERADQSLSLFNVTLANVVVIKLVEDFVLRPRTIFRRT